MLLNNNDLLAAQGRFEAARIEAEKSHTYKLVIAAILYKLAVIDLKLGFPERAK
jgi:hypothetical protein